MRVLRDELPQLRVTSAEPVDLPSRLAQCGFEPRDLTLETADLVGERDDCALLRVRVGRAVDSSRTKCLFEETEDCGRATLVCLIDLG
jgi:hypothetical protein